MGRSACEIPSLLGIILSLKWKICSLDFVSNTAPFPSGKEKEEGASQVQRL